MAVIYGNAGNNFIIGFQGNDQIYGFGGNDSLDGSGGNDMLFGNQQRDVLFGSFGDDSMYGGSDNDSLDGGIANDLLFGDNGNDTLRGNSGTDVLRGGSGADLFILDSEDSYPDFNPSQGDKTDPPLPPPFVFIPNNNLSSNSSSENLLLTDSDSTEMPLYLEFKQVGEDLLIRTSWMEGEGYATFTGLGAEINNPLQFPDWFVFSTEPSEPYTGPFDSTSIEEADTYADYSYITAEESERLNQQLLDQLDLSIDPLDPLYGLRVSEATLIQGIEQLEAGGSLADLGWLGEGEATAEDLEGALADVQGYIADELTRQEEEAAAEADSLLLPEMPLVEKRVFFIEEGAAISAEFQEMTMGSEVFFLPEGYFTPVEFESLF